MIDKETLQNIHKKWCELRKLSLMNMTFLEFVEEEKDKEEYKPKTKVLYSSHSTNAPFVDMEPY